MGGFMSAFRPLALLGLSSLLLGCPNEIDPVPTPGPFECASTQGLSGVVSVKDPIPGRYIVVLKDQAPGLEASAVKAMAESVAKGYGVSEVQAFESSLRGFSCAGSRSAVSACVRNDACVKP